MTDDEVIFDASRPTSGGRRASAPSRARQGGRDRDRGGGRLRPPGVLEPTNAKALEFVDLETLLLYAEAGEAQ